MFWPSVIRGVQVDLGDATKPHEGLSGLLEWILFCYTVIFQADLSLYPVFVFESSMITTLTEYAMKGSGKLHGQPLLLRTIFVCGSTVISGRRVNVNVEESVHGPSRQSQCGPESCWTASTWKELRYIELCICNVKLAVSSTLDDFPWDLERSVNSNLLMMPNCCW